MPQPMIGQRASSPAALHAHDLEAGAGGIALVADVFNLLISASFVTCTFR